MKKILLVLLLLFLVPSTTFAAITWNPYDKSSKVILSNNNMTATSSISKKGVRLNQGIEEGKSYFEYYILSSRAMIGIANDTQSMESFEYRDANNMLYYSALSPILFISSDTNYGTSFGKGDVIGVALDLEYSTPRVNFYKNGTAQGWVNLPTQMRDKAVFPALSHATETSIATINLGKDDFVYDIPDGFSAYIDFFDVQELDTPDNLNMLSNGMDYIEITWSFVVGATSYNIYVNEVLLDDTEDNTYIILDLEPATEYNIQIQAVDGDILSDLSEALTASTTEIEPLPAPVLSVTDTDMDYISISWPPITGAVNYKIYRNGQMIDTIAGTGYTYGGLSPYVYYNLGVRAVQFYNGQYLDGKLGELTAATDVVPDLPEPEDFVITEKTMFTFFTAWEPVDDATGYFMYKNGIKIGSTQQTEYTFANLQPGTEYTLEVEPYRIIGGVIYGGEKAELIEETNLLSGGITYLWLVSKGSNEVTMAWTGIDAATGYRIYRDGSLLTQLPGSKTEYEAIDLERGRTYQFYVTSIVDSIESDPSNVIEARTQLPVYETSLRSIIGRITSVARSMSVGFKLALAVIIAGKVVLFVMYLIRRGAFKL